MVALANTLVDGDGVCVCGVPAEVVVVGMKRGVDVVVGLSALVVVVDLAVLVVVGLLDVVVVIVDSGTTSETTEENISIQYVVYSSTTVALRTK